jgi:hypothetical protein
MICRASAPINSQPSDGRKDFRFSRGCHVGRGRAGHLVLVLRRERLCCVLDDKEALAWP